MLLCDRLARISGQLIIFGLKSVAQEGPSLSRALQVVGLILARNIDGNLTMHGRVGARFIIAVRSSNQISASGLRREAICMLRTDETIGHVSPSPALLGQAYSALRQHGGESVFQLDRIGASGLSAKLLERVHRGWFALLVIPGQFPGMSFVDI